jgi:hypothetical protein
MSLNYEDNGNESNLSKREKKQNQENRPIEPEGEASEQNLPLNRLG